ncbi:hypothetical protein DPMN_085061 [Dreissena polymorpha]|uniref:Uncharacterized protein n=1 Tax=Dreissena polymorpha TaxID=45954 RepID=A0A9D3YBP6_DREPO|nr:hypothetical protein DPMN_085061 [Dreissena polymorpha]
MQKEKTSPLHYLKDANGLSNLWKVKDNPMGDIVNGYDAYGFYLNISVGSLQFLCYQW